MIGVDNMKKLIEISIKIIVILVIMQNIFIPRSQAGFWDEIFEAGDNFIEEGKSQR